MEHAHRISCANMYVSTARGKNSTVVIRIESHTRAGILLGPRLPLRLSSPVRTRAVRCRSTVQYSPPTNPSSSPPTVWVSLCSPHAHASHPECGLIVDERETGMAEGKVEFRSELVAQLSLNRPGTRPPPSHACTAPWTTHAHAGPNATRPPVPPQTPGQPASAHHTTQYVQ